MSWQRVSALILKYAFICSRTAMRAMDVFFWPVMDLLVWGFLTVYMLQVSNTVPALVTFLIGAIIMWNVLYRAQQVVCISFLEDVWSRNLLNVFASPIRISEFIAAAYIIGFLQAAIVLILLSVLAAVIYSFNILSIGFTLGLLFVNLLIMGWSLGLVSTAFIIRYGPQAEVFAWAVPFLVQPVCAIFYPVSVLPVWLQAVASCVPASYVFEGMREIIAGSPSDPWWNIGMAFALNIVYLLLAGLLFKYMFELARQRGLLTRYCA